MKRVKLFVTVILILISLFALSATAISVEDEAYYSKFKGKDISLNVFNWGEYISDGSDDSIDVIEEFEKISGIKVNYTMYTDNEDMYSKLANSSSQYDIVIPSDYMVARLIDEERLEKLNYDNIPNIKFIDEKYHKTEFDPTGEYCVPYTWGLVGIVYNTKYITEQEASTWNVLWDEKNNGKVLMFGNCRDAFGIALFKLGYSINTENHEEIQQAFEALVEQKKVNQAYVMDETFDKMANENAYAAPYYAGDCVTMMDRNENLNFAYPSEGVNIFIDSACIPKGTKNKEAAEAFINFLCETDVAVANCEYISYFTPHTEADKIVDHDMRIYPSEDVKEKAQTFRMLSNEANHQMEDLWQKLRATSSFDNTLFPLAIIILLALIIFLILYVIRKRKKNKIDY